MDVGDFLQRAFAGYLFADLDSMTSAQHRPNDGGGGCSYPMLGASLAAMDLLGYLLKPGNSKQGSGATKPARKPDYTDTAANVGFYWREILALSDATYAQSADLVKPLVDLVRHPVMHSFAVGPGIEVRKDGGPPLSWNADRLVVDALRLATDLKASYSATVLRVLAGDTFGRALTGTTRATVQARFDRIEADLRHELKDAGTTLQRHKVVLPAAPAPVLPSLNYSGGTAAVWVGDESSSYRPYAPDPPTP